MVVGAHTPERARHRQERDIHKNQRKKENLDDLQLEWLYDQRTMGIHGWRRRKTEKN